MSYQATAWATRVRCGTTARKAVLQAIASYAAPHEGEADGYHSCFPGQESLAWACEMSIRSLRDQIVELVSMGLIQRRMRFTASGARTSDWYRLPVRDDENGSIFDLPETVEARPEWPIQGQPANLAGGENPYPPYVENVVQHLVPPANNRVTTGKLLPGNSKFLEQLDIKPTNPTGSRASNEKTLVVTPENPTAQTLIGEWLDHCKHRPPANVIGQVAKQVRGLLEEGIGAEQVRKGFALWHSRSLHPSTLPSVINEILNPRTAAQQAKPSTTDQRVGAGLALVEKYRQMEKQNAALGDSETSNQNGYLRLANNR